MIGDFSMACAIEVERLRFMLQEQALLATVEGEVIDDVEVREMYVKVAVLLDPSCRASDSAVKQMVVLQE